MTIRSSFARAALLASVVTVPFALDAFTFSSHAQNSAPASKPAAKTPYETTIASDSTLVRSAPSVESGYPFGSLRQGATVKVVEEQVGWVAVQTSGSAFDGWFGFVQSGPGIAVSADGKSLKVSSRAQISAPNAEANWNPDSSWKAIGFLVSGDEVAVLGEVKGQRDTFYKVALNTKSVGWINASAITPAPSATPANQTAETPKPETKTETKPETKPTDTGAPAVPGTTTTNAPAVQTGEKVAADSNPVDPDPSQEAEATTAKKPANTAESRAQAVEKIRRVHFKDIDAVWQRVAKEPVETAELEQLRERFLALAEDPSTPRSESIAATRRAEQIAVRIDVQKGLLEIAALRQKANASVDGVANLELAMKTRQPWDAVGRLNASSVYNGERLPLLYRLQDQGTGQTIAYILPTPEFDLPSMLGLLIGVKGPMRYDESLRLNTILPTQIGPLSSKDINPASSGATSTTAPTGATATGGEGKTDTAK